MKEDFTFSTGSTLTFSRTPSAAKRVGGNAVLGGIFWVDT